MSKQSAAGQRRQQRVTNFHPLGNLGANMPVLVINENNTNAPQQDLQEQVRVLSETEFTGLFQKINSTEKGERQWAIVSLSRLVNEDAEVFQTFYKNPSLLDAIIKAIFDGELGVRVAATGLLRNLSLDVNQFVNVVLEKMIQLGCVSSLVAILQKYAAAFREEGEEIPESKQPIIPEINEITQLLINTICLFTNLCEVNEQCLERFAREELINVLFGFINTSIPVELCKYSALFLSVVTEDYEPVLNQIQAGHVNLMREFIANECVPHHIKVLLVGVLINYRHTIENDIGGFLFVICKCLEFNGKNIFQGILNLAPEMQQKIVAEGLSLEFEKEFDIWKDLLDGEVNALEILTNLLIDENSVEQNGVFHLPPFLANALLGSGAFNQVLALCAFLDPQISALEAVVHFAPYIELLKKVNNVALACLGNIILSLPDEALNNVSELWNFLFVLLIASFDLPNVTIEVQRNVANCMHSLCRRSKIIPDEKQVELIAKLFTHTDSELRVNAIGILGRFAVVTLNDNIAKVLIEIIVKALNDDSNLVIVEAVDTIFSVFDDNFDGITQAYNILPMLAEFSTYLKKKIAALDQNENPLVLDKLTEVQENIPEFLKYKKYRK